MKLIYIAGPYSSPYPNTEQQNAGDAALVAAQLNLAGQGKLFAMCPHVLGRVLSLIMNSIQPEFDQNSFWLPGDVEWVKRCDGILFLPDWENSKGCGKEMIAAHYIVKAVLKAIDSDEIKRVAELFIKELGA